MQKQNETLENRWKVKLRNANTSSGERVSFHATPDIIENRNVNYKSIDPVHAPGQIYVFGNTMSRSFHISSIKLISRTISEASANLATLWRLRSWTMPQFGKSTISDEQQSNRSSYNEKKYTPYGKTQSEEFGSQTRGAPPAILLLSAYSVDSGYGSDMQHINKVPVAIQQLSIPYPSDVDYITTKSGVPMPTIMTLDLSLIETQAPSSFENFDLNQYRNGTLRGF